MTRRWLYRYVNSPHTPVLNVYDPSFQTQRMLQASIIQEIGILKQGLVSVSVQDIWGQESIENSAARQNSSPLKNHHPALSTLETINRAVHGYGAWTFCRDNFPPDHIKLLQNAQTDFVADTLLMPALEQALSQEKNTQTMDYFKMLTGRKKTPLCFRLSKFYRNKKSTSKAFGTEHNAVFLFHPMRILRLHNLFLRKQTLPGRNVPF